MGSKLALACPLSFSASEFFPFFFEFFQEITNNYKDFPRCHLWDVTCCSLILQFLPFFRLSGIYDFLENLKFTTFRNLRLSGLFGTIQKFTTFRKHLKFTTFRKTQKCTTFRRVHPGGMLRNLDPQICPKPYNNHIKPYKIT